MNLRIFGLTAAVVCAALLPLVASAGSPGPLAGPGGLTPGSGPATAPEGATAPVRASAPPATDARARTERARTDPPDSVAPAAPAAPAERTVERCGPEVASPAGVEAQTCVLSDGVASDAGTVDDAASGGVAGGGGIWARAYYRNATGGELLAVLSLMGPRGRTVQTYCAIAADDEPATCETSREPFRGKRSGYLAMAEFAAPGEDGTGADDGPLLLRSGSNSPGPDVR
ncbi:hypothetical protein ACFXKG_16160 [Streptomyces sp. NPDC059255]|uniref:hypothetical protein n=1 Tax=Streptomyces sp. NPDC059255 TaxID=3346793 RepID=UPI0036A27E33